MSGHICVVDRLVTEEKFREQSRNNYFHQNHIHIGYSQLREFHEDGSLQPVQGLEKDEEGRSPDYIFEWLIPGKVIRYKRELHMRDMASKWGTYLAEAVKRKKPWALAMINDMRAHKGPSWIHNNAEVLQGHAELRNRLKGIGARVSKV